MDKLASMPSIISIIDRSFLISSISACGCLVCASTWCRILSRSRSIIMLFLRIRFNVDISHSSLVVVCVVSSVEGMVVISWIVVVGVKSVVGWVDEVSGST
ncbi:hypothetical protein DPMN_108632 [Dreissena polymorpha]|uniref:Transmembrane protein n=1 Tax=Dreissena polymorpha TaxID=45954 RepID=A0A9D4K8W2_DREPO|nr:hypothetical protein DPMN_108632 [Dreissena polymorpha]